jgi:uncharacterized metal-binding protein YceD (DUF177 family)
MTKPAPSDDSQALRSAPVSQPVRTATLNLSRGAEFDLHLSAPQLEAMAATLGIVRLRKARFTGRIAAEPGGGWRLTGHLGATVVQSCIVTLDPVTTRIEEEVARRYLPDYRDPAAGAEPDDEIELPDDVDTEALGPIIDPGAVMTEALALALPLYPRAQSADLAQTAFTEPGKPAMTDADARPFASLASLRDKMKPQ